MNQIDNSKSVVWHSYFCAKFYDDIYSVLGRVPKRVSVKDDFLMQIFGFLN